MSRMPAPFNRSPQLYRSEGWAAQRVPMGLVDETGRLVWAPWLDTLAVSSCAARQSMERFFTGVQSQTIHVTGIFALDGVLSLARQRTLDWSPESQDSPQLDKGQYRHRIRDDREVLDTSTGS